MTSAARSQFTTRARALDPAQDPFGADALRQLVARYGSPLLVIDAERLRAQYRRLGAALPGVVLHYAVKSMPHPAVLAVLRDVGASFDLATTGEVELMRRLGIASSRCIHTHPIKRDMDIRNALAYGVNRFVVDNPDEIKKFGRLRRAVSLLIRVAFRGHDAHYDLSRKFGCEPEMAPQLIEQAAALGLEVEGLSFHAGSQATDPERHADAVRTCLTLMERAAAAGQRLRTLDIGGGFPIDYGPGAIPIEDFCAPIMRALEALPAGVEVIAEPGRYLSAPSAVSVSSVMGRAERDGLWWYYLDDGLYGSYSGQMFDHVRYPLEALVPAGPTYPSVLAGPTCDSNDVIAEDVSLPLLENGDLVVGRTMGAYTWASASEFNLFPRATVIALDRGYRVCVDPA